MKSLLISIKNIVPYILLIGIYFFFVNLEARNELKNYKKNPNSKSNVNENNKIGHINNNSSRISIPVIPYE
tara:strand:+ start:570 stop:782 length:213 start_codon:yes stop_codon:yes gene_type:complete